jgi:hypothetical protein
MTPQSPAATAQFFQDDFRIEIVGGSAPRPSARRGRSI